MIKPARIAIIADKELESLIDAGYMVPENEDFERAQAIMITSRNIAEKVYAEMEADQYIKVDGKFYLKRDVLQLQGVDPNVKA